MHGTVVPRGDGDPMPRRPLMRRLREDFRPEFLNRIDEIVIFRQLDEAQLRQITDLLLEHTRRRLHAQGITVDFTAEAVDWLARHGSSRTSVRGRSAGPLSGRSTTACRRCWRASCSPASTSS